jgi:hypothetical protein
VEKAVHTIHDFLKNGFASHQPTHRFLRAMQTLLGCDALRYRPGALSVAVSLLAAGAGEDSARAERAREVALKAFDDAIRHAEQAGTVRIPIHMCSALHMLCPSPRMTPALFIAQDAFPCPRLTPQWQIVSSRHLHIGSSAQAGDLPELLRGQAEYLMANAMPKQAAESYLKVCSRPASAKA